MSKHSLLVSDLECFHVLKLSSCKPFFCPLPSPRWEGWKPRMSWKHRLRPTCWLFWRTADRTSRWTGAGMRPSQVPQIWGRSVLHGKGLSCTSWPQVKWPGKQSQVWERGLALLLTSLSLPCKLCRAAASCFYLYVFTFVHLPLTEKVPFCSSNVCWSPTERWTVVVSF